MYQNINFKQITLITDGHSNKGLSPILAAKEASEQQITVNVIGIKDEGLMGEKGEQEIKAIASAGGGISQIVSIDHIARTVQLVTRKAINQTIQQIVHSQLKQILGKKDINLLPPNERVEIVGMIDQISEYSQLDILLLIDTSASMIPKMKRIKEAIDDFQMSISSRLGQHHISIATYSGDGQYLDILIPWTDHAHHNLDIFQRIKPSGLTPTGPAILEGISYFSKLDKLNFESSKGLLDEYII